MARRTLKPHHQDDIRAKIQASQLVNALTDHVLGKHLLTDPSQVAAALGLLRKTVPDLSSVEQTTVETMPADTDIRQSIQRIISEHPDLLRLLIAEQARAANSAPAVAVVSPEQSSVG